MVGSGTCGSELRRRRAGSRLRWSLEKRRKSRSTASTSAWRLKIHVSINRLWCTGSRVRNRS